MNVSWALFWLLFLAIVVCWCEGISPSQIVVTAMGVA